MPEQVDTRVSPALHPDTVKAIDGYTAETAPFIADAISAFTEAYSVVGKVWDATEAGKKNGAWTEDQRLLAVSKFANTEQIRATRKLDAAHVALTKGVDHIERELSAPIASKASLGIAAEIRQHCKALKGDQRLGFVRSLIESGDELSASAVLGGPAFLSGIDADMQATFTRMYHAKANPALEARLTVMRSALDKIGRDGPLIFAQIAKAVGAPAARVQGIDAANERALAALKTASVD